MISSFRNFAKTKFAGLLVFLMIIPFVFWGMGSMFSSGNTNNIAKINKTNISTKVFMEYLNNSGVSQETIKKNLNNNIIEELLSGLISATLIDLEIEDFNLIISENTLLKKIKKNKNFLDENNIFQRIRYEKFLLENKLSAVQFEKRLKKRDLQKNLFDYIGAGTVSPKFLVSKLYEEENKKIEIEFINLNIFYKKKDVVTELDLKNFVTEHKDQLKVEYVDFSYAKLNPKNLTGVDDFNQLFFDKIDQIEVDISNDVEFKRIVADLSIVATDVKNFKYSSEKNEIEKKIFDLKTNKFDIFENGNNYILYKIDNIELKEVDLNDKQTREEIAELVTQKNKFDYNRKLLEEINSKKFSKNDFLDMGKNNIKKINLSSVRDDKKFEMNAVEILYSLPVNSFTLINDKQNNIYLARVIKFEDKQIAINDNQLKEYNNKQNSKSKNSMLKSYDLFLKNKYNVILNQKTIERVKNYFQ